MATKEEIRAEAIRRGLIKPSKDDIAEEAKRRGLIGDGPAMFQGQPAQERGEPITTLRTPPTAEEVERQKAVYGIPETVATAATAGLSEPIAGLAGIVGGILPGEEGQAKEFVEATREAMTYQPRGEAGKETVSALGTILSGLPDVSKNIGDFTYEMTGSPTLATVAATTPTLVAELIGLKGLRSLKSGTRLIDDMGRPTKQLRKALDKEGLDFDQLSPQAKETIPEVIEPSMISTPTAKSQAENALVKQIEAGGREDALSGLEVVDGRLKSDPLGNEAVKQGFTPGFVQAVKTSNPETKTKMLEMSNMMRSIKGNERLALEMRPSDVIGNSVSDRLKFIRDDVRDSSKQLDNIAKTELPGKTIDPQGVLNAFEDAMIDLDVWLKYPPRGGKPVPDFKNSLISKDKSSQRIIKDAIDLLSEGGSPDASRAHKLKKQLDIMIDFKKKSPIGLTDAGKKVLKKIRASLNESIRDVSPEYAAVNDRLSMSLDSLDSIDNAVGTIDIFGDRSNQAIGQKMRALMSNQQGRIKLENAIDSINSATESLGGAFNDDLRDLVMFYNGLNKRFGTPAETSFAGQITQATEEAARRVGGGVSKADIAAGVIRKTGEKLEKLRGIDDFNAFESIDAILTKETR